MTSARSPTPGLLLPAITGCDCGSSPIGAARCEHGDRATIRPFGDLARQAGGVVDDELFVTSLADRLAGLTGVEAVSLGVGLWALG